VTVDDIIQEFKRYQGKPVPVPYYLMSEIYETCSVLGAQGPLPGFTPSSFKAEVRAALRQVLDVRVKAYRQTRAFRNRVLGGKSC